MDISSEGHSRVLIVDDDAKVRNLLHEYLLAEGLHATAVSNGAQFRAEFSAGKFDLVLLDIGLPGEDGLSLARELRATSNVGIIMLTGRHDIVDRIVGLEIGADDYITKPFHLREVLARVKALIRRLNAGRRPDGAGDASKEAGASIAFGDWQLILDQRRLLDGNGGDVGLTAGEFDLLAALVRNAGRVLTRDQLINLTKGPAWIALDRTIDAHVARLRRKIEPDRRHPTFIKSVRGVGYVFSGKTTVSSDRVDTAARHRPGA